MKEFHEQFLCGIGAIVFPVLTYRLYGDVLLPSGISAPISMNIASGVILFGLVIATLICWGFGLSKATEKPEENK